MLEQIPAEALPAIWHLIGSDLEELLPGLQSGDKTAFAIRGTAAAIVLSAADTVDTGKRALWIEGLSGKVGLKPKAALALMGRVLAECEEVARQNGCTELRIEAGQRSAWKPQLLPAFGFEPHHVGEKLVMRKVLDHGDG